MRFRLNSRSPEKLSKKLANQYDMNLLFDLTQSVFNVFKQSADYFSRYVEQIVHYWEKRVGQFQVEIMEDPFVHVFRMLILKCAARCIHEL
jgi:hypothetical protein